ncbi:unnamed protein product [Schistosoma curassoni]|uniref:Ovule protein n=1 Tax=Schistosoma curassoni TaxID=6186 RepID=A0A183JU40_9TREM|nr:unnamed protein product [Schistosoma curassoni]
MLLHMLQPLRLWRPQLLLQRPLINRVKMSQINSPILLHHCHRHILVDLIHLEGQLI